MLTDSERTRCRKLQDKVIARVERIWGDEVNVNQVRLIDDNGPLIKDARKLIFPDRVTDFEEMRTGDLCLSYDLIAYVPAL